MSPAVVVTYSLLLFYFYFPGLLNNLESSRCLEVSHY